MTAVPARCQPVPWCSSFALQQLMKPFPDFRRTKVLPLPQHFLQRLSSQLRGSNPLLSSAPHAAPLPATGGCLSLNVLSRPVPSPPEQGKTQVPVPSASNTLPSGARRGPRPFPPACWLLSRLFRCRSRRPPPLPISCSKSRWFLQAEELERRECERSRQERALRHRQRRGRLGSGPRGARGAAGLLRAAGGRFCR